MKRFNFQPKTSLCSKVNITKYFDVSSSPLRGFYIFSYDRSTSHPGFSFWRSYLAGTRYEHQNEEPGYEVGSFIDIFTNFSHTSRGFMIYYIYRYKMYLRFPLIPWIFEITSTTEWTDVQQLQPRSQGLDQRGRSVRAKSLGTRLQQLLQFPPSFIFLLHFEQPSSYSRYKWSSVTKNRFKTVLRSKGLNKHI